jgi:cyclophilin family peptidyl-prolyl cis-trans isomerase
MLRVLIVALLFMAPLSWADENGSDKPRVRLETTLGNITLELDKTAAPKTVANFLSYVESGFYKDTLFHRVIKGFMIQGGGLDERMDRKPTREPVLNEADNGLKNIIGTIAMARTSSPHSATSQFFINTADNDSLDHRNKSSRGYGYCVFGKVVDGMDVVRKIENVDTISRAGRNDVPIDLVMIHQVVIEKKEASVD